MYICEQKLQQVPTKHTPIYTTDAVFIMCMNMDGVRDIVHKYISKYMQWCKMKIITQW